MTSSIHLTVPNITSGGESRRVTHVRDDDIKHSFDIFYEFNRVVPWSDKTIFDGHVMPLLFYAMQRGQPLRVHGSLSESIMRNLDELQSAWCCWKPDKYTHIDVIPDGVINAKRVGTSKTISAFSGGVDASFTAIRHARSANPTRYPLTDVLMVNGFDVSLSNPTHFDQLVGRVQPLLTELALNLTTVRTNSKELLPLDWEDTFAVQLAACLHMLSEEFQYCLIGSSEPYNAMIFPWGSTPATDYLMSGDRMTVVHDGAAFSRTEKIAALINCPTACKTVKVCWTGKDQGQNCGSCEKCIRTKLNFLAAGNVSPECFDSSLELSSIEGMEIMNEPQLAELQGIVNYAEKMGSIPEWLPILKKRIAKGTSTHEPSWLKSGLIIVLKRLGLEDAAKEFWHQIWKT